MKLSTFFDLAVKFGLKKDLRTKKEILDEMAAARKAYKRLKGADKKFFDREKLKHPYADTRILYGDPGKDIKTVMVGIDIEAPELLLAERLIEKGLGIDACISHHPKGKALSSFHEVMHLQKNMLVKLGIKQKIAKTLLDERISEVARSVSPVNHTRGVDVARLLDIAYLCVHTPADNHVTNYLQSLLDKKRPKKVRDILRVLKSIPEYRVGLERGAGPALIAGEEKNASGKIFVDMTGGTEGSKKVFARLSQAGVGTIIAMHLSEEHFKSAKPEDLNLIIAGHIASDNLGLNLLLDNIEKEAKEELNVIDCSGFTRVKRK